MLLPEPLGPTRPSTSPRSTVKLTPSTAVRPPKWRMRSLTSSRGSRVAGHCRTFRSDALASGSGRPSRAVA